MANIPFPSTLVRLSAGNAAASYARADRPRDHETEGVACYRTPDGALRMAYDPYKPEYPEGAVPGIGRVRHSLQHYANETSGYRSTVVDFFDINDLSLGGMTIDQTTAGLAIRGRDVALVVAADEREMAGIADLLAVEDIRIERAPISTRTGHEHGELNAFMAARFHGRLEILAAEDEAGLHDLMRRRFSVAPDEADPAGQIVDLCDHIRSNGHQIVIGGRDTGPDLERSFSIHLTRDTDEDTPEPEM